MKRTLFYYTLALKSLTGFCEPVTQEMIEAKIAENSNLSFKQYTNYPCPRYICVKDDRDETMINEFVNFFPQEAHLNLEEQFKSLSLSKSSFEQYSRELTANERKNLPNDLKETPIRIVDFESVIAGFHNDELKSFAEHLQSDQKQLREALFEWVQNKSIYAKLSCKHFHCITYLPNESIQQHCKANMVQMIEKLLTFKVGREVLTLVLCIEKFENKILKLFIGEGSNHLTDLNEIFLDFSSNDIIESQDLYQDCNEWINYNLHLYPNSKIAGNFSSSFEKSFLQSIRDDEFYKEKAETIEEIPLNEGFSPESQDKVKALKIFDLQTTWCSLENLWDYVGFANINDTIYVKLFSDMDLLKHKPFWGSGWNYHNNHYNDVLKKLLKKGPQKPSKEAWKVWLKLHHLPQETEYLFTPDFVKNIKQKQMELFNEFPLKLNEKEKKSILKHLFDFDIDGKYISEEIAERTIKFQENLRSIEQKLATIYLESAMNGEY